VDVLRALLRPPSAQWPEVAHPLHAAALAAWRSSSISACVAPAFARMHRSSAALTKAASAGGSLGFRGDSSRGV
jgi:hypothetical protein